MRLFIIWSFFTFAARQSADYRLFKYNRLTGLPQKINFFFVPPRGGFGICQFYFYILIGLRNWLGGKSVSKLSCRRPASATSETNNYF